MIRKKNGAKSYKIIFNLQFYPGIKDSSPFLTNYSVNLPSFFDTESLWIFFSSHPIFTVS